MPTINSCNGQHEVKTIISCSSKHQYLRLSFNCSRLLFSNRLIITRWLHTNWLLSKSKFFPFTYFNCCVHVYPFCESFRIESILLHRWKTSKCKTNCCRKVWKSIMRIAHRLGVHFATWGGTCPATGRGKARWTNKNPRKSPFFACSIYSYQKMP